MENLFPNGGLGFTGPGAKFASLTNTLTGSLHARSDLFLHRHIRWGKRSLPEVQCPGRFRIPGSGGHAEVLEHC